MPFRYPFHFQLSHLLLFYGSSVERRLAGYVRGPGKDPSSLLPPYRPAFQHLTQPSVMKLHISARGPLAVAPPDAGSQPSERKER